MGSTPAARRRAGDNLPDVRQENARRRGGDGPHRAAARARDPVDALRLRRRPGGRDAGMSDKHPHADERRRPSLDRQLEGTGLFSSVPGEMADERTPTVYAEVEPPIAPGPHRVGRRATAQDRAHGTALIHQGTHVEIILTHLRKDYRRGLTREQIHNETGIKLQTVCGRINDLLKRERNGKPAPLVYENGNDSSGAAYVYAFTPEALTLTHEAQ